MLFTYKAIDQNGQQRLGEIEAQSKDLAIASLQGRDLIVVEVAGQGKKSLLTSVKFLDKVSLKDIVIMSRQLSTLFEAQVSVVKAFNLLSDTTKSEGLRAAMQSVSQDLQAGISIEKAMGKHPKVFTDFYIGMVRTGSESGKLRETFSYLADYLERQYELKSKVRNALIYPSFIFLTFVVVMVLVLTLIIPNLAEIIRESGQDLPLQTKIIFGMSDFMLQFGWLLLILLAGGGFAVWRYASVAAGSAKLDQIKLKAPYFGNLYRKMYLTRIADNLNTMLSAGIPVVKALEITSGVVGNELYREILLESAKEVKAGNFISTAFEKYDEMPSVMVQMMKIGEESGSIGVVLETLTRFYKREVDNAVDTLISLIEPAMIILLALGVGVLLTSVLSPMYNLANTI